jgi:hypothetical protein
VLDTGAPLALGLACSLRLVSGWNIANPSFFAMVCSAIIRLLSGKIRSCSYADSVGLASPSELLASPSELLTSPSELLASPSELLASPSELLASPSELLVSPSELVASPSELVASPSELLASPSEAHLVERQHAHELLLGNFHGPLLF